MRKIGRGAIEVFCGGGVRLGREGEEDANKEL